MARLKHKTRDITINVFIRKLSILSFECVVAQAAVCSCGNVARTKAIGEFPVSTGGAHHAARALW